MAGFVFFFGPRLPHIRLSACVSFPSNSAVHCFHAFPASFLASSASSFGSLWMPRVALLLSVQVADPNIPRFESILFSPLLVYASRSTLAHRVSGPLQPPPLTSPPPPRRLTRLPLCFPSPIFCLERPHNRTADLSRLLLETKLVAAVCPNGTHHHHSSPRAHQSTLTFGWGCTWPHRVRSRKKGVPLFLNFPPSSFFHNLQRWFTLDRMSSHIPKHTVRYLK